MTKRRHSVCLCARASTSTLWLRSHRLVLSCRIFTVTTLYLRNATVHYFCISLNSVKGEPVIMSFGIQNPEVTPEKNVTAIPCEMQNFFIWSKLYDFPPKLENF